MKLSEMTAALNHAPKCYRDAAYEKVRKSYTAAGKITIAHSGLPTYEYSEGAWRKIRV